MERGRRSLIVAEQRGSGEGVEKLNHSGAERERRGGGEA